MMAVTQLLHSAPAASQALHQNEGESEAECALEYSHFNARVPYGIFTAAPNVHLVIQFQHRCISTADLKEGEEEEENGA